MKIKITKMTLLDLDIIKDDLYNKFDNLWNYEIFKEELANTNSEYLIIKNKNEIIGYGGIKIILDTAEIMNIVIRQDSRGKRIFKNFT